MLHDSQGISSVDVTNPSSNLFIFLLCVCSTTIINKVNILSFHFTSFLLSQTFRVYLIGLAAECIQADDDDDDDDKELFDKVDSTASIDSLEDSCSKTSRFV